eukprot:6477763-Pyramimonas_sp.AAC.1
MVTDRGETQRVSLQKGGVTFVWYMRAVCRACETVVSVWARCSKPHRSSHLATCIPHFVSLSLETRSLTQP